MVDLVIIIGFGLVNSKPETLHCVCIPYLIIQLTADSVATNLPVNYRYTRILENGQQLRDENPSLFLGIWTKLCACAHVWGSKVQKALVKVHFSCLPYKTRNCSKKSQQYISALPASKSIKSVKDSTENYTEGHKLHLKGENHMKGHFETAANSFTKI